MSSAPKIKLIRRSTLRPGDYILIKCDEKEQENVSVWAKDFFHGTQTVIGIIPHSVTVEVISDRREKEKLGMQ